MKPFILEQQYIVPEKKFGGRGKILFPEWLDLKVSKDGTKGDCILYENLPEIRKRVLDAKRNYNARTTGKFKDYRFVHRYDTYKGIQVVIIQRIS